jgi:hypothetical protein
MHGQPASRLTVARLAVLPARADSRAASSARPSQAPGPAGGRRAALSAGASNADRACMLVTPRWFVRWLGTVATLLLAIAWIVTNFCSVRWQSASGRWGELADGRIIAGKSPAAPDGTAFDFATRPPDARMNWAFDVQSPAAWAVPIWAPMAAAMALAFAARSRDRDLKR